MQPNRASDSESSSANNNPEVSCLALPNIQLTHLATASLKVTPSHSYAEAMSEIGGAILHKSPFSSHHSDSGLLPVNLYSFLPSPTTTQLVIQPNVFTALFLNGEMLGLTCSADLAGKSLSPTSSTPIPLRPTNSQLTTVHYQWIDRFPFPKLRDSLIRLQGVVDLQDFLNDIFVMPSFEIKPGAETWEPRAWKMEGAWARKWGWLFF